ncbi:UbiA prenyltransferase family-domain-containing protein [Aspergillus californicus]
MVARFFLAGLDGSRSRRQFLRDLMSVSRFDKYNPLLAVFCGVWSTLLAGVNKMKIDPEGTSVFSVFRQTWLCFIYCWVLCGAGMVWNDWVDRDIDARVERTKNRPLASGRLTSADAFMWMGVQYIASCGILYWMLDGHHFWASLLPVTVGTILYPYGKRPTAAKLRVYPQYILGFTLSYPAVTGWSSIFGAEQTTGEVISHCLPLLLFGFFWTIYFNTAYSYQDVVDDTKMSVNSSYVAAGRYIHMMVIVLGLMVLGSIPFVLVGLGSTWLWLSWMGVWSISYLEQFAKFDAKRPETGGLVHRRNRTLGLWTIAVLSMEAILQTL